MQPKISVITVCYNSENYIEEAIKSVISQPYKNKEYVIIDGDSKDKTLEIINKYADKIDVIISEPDRGISDAFNKGIKHATGDVICIVNSDDIMPENALENFANQYEEGIDVFRGDELIRNLETGSEYIMNPTMKYCRIPIGFNVCHMATYIRRDAFERFGYYDVNFHCSMDRELLFRFHRQGSKEKRMKGVYGIFILGGISQNSGKRKIVEAKEMMHRMECSLVERFIYVSYVRLRLLAKQMLSK